MNISDYAALTAEGRAEFTASLIRAGIIPDYAAQSAEFRANLTAGQRVTTRRHGYLYYGTCEAVSGDRATVSWDDSGGTDIEAVSTLDMGSE